MKLAKIGHWRCGSPEYKSTYVWVPDGMSDEVLQALVKSAREDCLQSERNVNGEAEPKYKTWWAFLSDAEKLPGFMDATLAELKGEYEKQEADYKSWTVKRDAARKSFAQRLKDLSGGTVSLFWDVKAQMSATCDWGHNHGVHVDYGDTEIE